jgi:hypothetical protein
MVDWTLRNNKRFQREQLFVGVPPVTNYLTLPGNQALDVIEGASEGILTKGTHICAAERDKEAYKEAKIWFRDNWPGTVSFFCDDLHQLKLDRPYDLVFLDYLGNISRSGITWMESELQNNLAPLARVALTTLKSFRGNKFFAHLYGKLHQELPALMKKDAITWRDRGSYPISMLGYLSVYSVLLKTFIFTRNVYHISAYFYGENTASVMIFFTIDFKEGVRCLTPEEIHAQQIISGVLGCSVSKPFSGEVPMATASEYVDKFLAAPKTYDSMRGLKASLTKFCEKKERETGTPARRFRAAIKAVITRKGGDSSSL